MTMRYLWRTFTFLLLMNNAIVITFLLLMGIALGYIFYVPYLFFIKNYLLMSAVILGISLLSFLILRATVISLLIFFDLNLIAAPQKDFVVGLPLEKVRARVVRGFVEYEAEFTTLDSFLFYPEKGFLYFIKKVFVREFPLIFISRYPLVFVRLFRADGQTRAMVIGDEEIHAATLIKLIETELKQTPLPPEASRKERNETLTRKGLRKRF
ncbi:hypothetical protein HY991_04755 [Candidatus Micrarchaeota archaeon]|nr:hypothetical protein [Candidatus Micrarchaeota archaeon]